jgi:hypothetical protein
MWGFRSDKEVVGSASGPAPSVDAEMTRRLILAIGDLKAASELSARVIGRLTWLLMGLTAALGALVAVLLVEV